MCTKILLLVFFWAVSCFAQDTLFHNGLFYTAEPSSATSRWMHVRDGKILALGDQQTLPKNFSGNRVDLKGDVVIAGLTDSHVHLMSRGEELSQIDLRGAKSAEEASQKVALALRSSPNENGIIVGNGWDQSEWPGQDFPNRSLLDKIATSRPIILYRIDGHAAWVNTSALRKSGLWLKKTDPKGGKIARDPKGIPTGILLDTAMAPVSALIPPVSQHKAEKYLELAVREALKFGITSVHDAGVGANELEAIRRLLASGRVKFRFYEMLSGASLPELRTFLKKGIETGSFQDQLTVRTVKLFQDGAMGSRGAAFHSAYADDKENKGLLRFSKTDLEKLVTEIDAAGFQVAIHAIGTLANESAIDAYEKVLGKQVASKRPRLEHAQVLNEKDVARVGKLGIIASMQPTHCTSDMKWVEARIGKERARFAYAWKSLLDANVKLAFGSDVPVESFNPWLGWFAAVTRQDSQFHPEGGFFPKERLTRQEAYDAFTRGGAYAAFSESSRGSLAPGKWADFVRLDKDPFQVPLQEILQIKVKETYVAGEAVYRLQDEGMSE